MTRHMFLALGVLVPAIVLASGARAGAGSITFENVPGVTAMGFINGRPVLSDARLSTQLQLSDGVTFSSLDPVTFSLVADYVALVSLGEAHAVSPPNGIGGVNAAGLLDYDSAVLITFTLPGDPSTPAVTNLVSIRGDRQSGGGSATMKAFDVNGLLLGSVKVEDVTETGGAGLTAGLTLSLAIPNIHSIRLEQTPASFIAFDELIFNPLSAHGLQAPIANAGADQSIHAGRLVTLDGTGSFDDNTPTEQLIFSWALSSKPDGSSAALARATTSRPSFMTDLPGVYTATLTVTDADGLASAPAVVVVSSLNGAPIADAGPDKGAFVGDGVSLDALMSQDPDLDTLGYSWTLATPPGSRAVLARETTATPTFTPDVPGSYTATLTVNDSFGGVATDSLVVAVTTGGQFAEKQVVLALNMIGALTREQVTTRGNQNALQQFLTHVIAALQAGDLDKARDKLTKAIARTDGCALRGIPDGDGYGRDWVTDCAAQTPVYAALTAALGALTP